MELIIIIFLVAIISVLTYILLKGSKNSDSDTLVQLTSSLTNQIQDVRKEINDNSEKSRVEIESKLKTINKEILDFQNNSTSSLQKQFAESSKIIKDVTAELITELFFTITHPTDGFLFVLPRFFSANLKARFE